MLFTISIIILVLFIASYFLPIGSGNSTVHGSAHFSKNTLLKKSNTGYTFDGIRSINKEKGFTSSLVLAPSGVGKTTTFCLPNVLNLVDESAIITDPKGELYELCSGYLREKKGYKILLLDFLHPEQSGKYNPLKRVNTDIEIKDLCSSIYNMVNVGVKTDSVWQQMAISLLEVFARTLKNTPDEKYMNFANLINLFHYITDGSKKIPTLISKYAPNQEVKDKYKSYLAQEQKVKLGQLSTALSLLVPFDTQQVKQITSNDDLDFNQFRKEKTVLFIITPAQDGAHNSILSLFYSQLFKHILNTPVSATDLPIKIIMEEFGNLRKIHDFTNTISLIRSKRCGVSLILQSISQLHSVYTKEASEIIIANTASVLAYSGIRDETTLNYLQSLCGKKTQENITSNGISHTSRELMTKDEIRTLPRHQALFIHGNLYPQKLFITPIYKNKSLMQKTGLFTEYNTLYANYTPSHSASSLVGEPIEYLPLEDTSNNQPSTHKVSIQKTTTDKEELVLKDKLNEILARKVAVEENI